VGPREKRGGNPQNQPSSLNQTKWITKKGINFGRNPIGQAASSQAFVWVYGRGLVKGLKHEGSLSGEVTAESCHGSPFQYSHLFALYENPNFILSSKFWSHFLSFYGLVC